MNNCNKHTVDMSNAPPGTDPITNDTKERLKFATKTRLKKKKRRKDLEHLRRSVLAAKRNVKRQSLPTRRNVSNKLPKNSLKSTLNMFADVRRDNENKTQGLANRKSGRKPRGKTICARLLPEPVIGIFKNGVKGKDVRRKAVKNFPLYEVNKAQLHADVFGLPNEEEHHSSDEISQNNENNSDNSDRNEKSKEERNFHSIPHHNFQPFDMIKGNSTFNNANSPKWISNSMGIRSSGEMRQVMSQNVSENVQKGDRYKRRVLKSCYDDDDHDTGVVTEIETHFSQNPLKAGGSLIRKELPTNKISDKTRSIRRWGISPAFCYDEFSKMVEEKFVFCASRADVSDPLVSIKATLVARYAEAREHQTNINNDSEDSCLSCTSSDEKIPNLNHSAIVHKSQDDSWTITRTSPQNNIEPINFLQDHSSINKNYENQIIPMNEGVIHDKSREFKRKFVKENSSPRKHTKRQSKKSLNCDWIIEPFSSSERVFTKNEKKYFRNDTHNIPILRPSDGGSRISFNSNVDEFCGMDNAINIQQTQKKLRNREGFRNHSPHENPNFSLASKIVVDRRNHSDNYSKRINHNIGFNDILASKYHHDKHPMYVGEHEYFPHCSGPSMPRSKSMYCSNFFLTMDKNTSSSGNYHYVGHDDREIISIPDIERCQNSNVPFWCTSDFNFDTESNSRPVNSKSTPRRHVRYYSDTNVQLNNSVLPELKGLSFEESDVDQISSFNDKYQYNTGNEPQNPRSSSNLYRPSKYYAVSNDNVDDSVPQRVPVYINAEKPHPMSKMIDEEIPRRVNASERTRKKTAALHTSNLEKKSRIESNRHEKYKKKSRQFPITLNHNFPMHNCNDVDGTNANIAAIANSNVRFQESFDPNNISHACEVVLNDGRVGLFVPRNYL